MVAAQVVSSGTSLAYSVLSSAVPLVTGAEDTTLTIYVSNPNSARPVSLQQIAIVLPVGNAAKPGAGDLTEQSLAIPTLWSSDGSVWQASSATNAFLIQLENGNAYSFTNALLTITFSGITVGSLAGTVVVEIQETLQNAEPTAYGAWLPKVPTSFPGTVTAQTGSLLANSAQIATLQATTLQATTATAQSVTATSVSAQSVTATSVTATSVSAQSIEATSIQAFGVIPLGGIIPYAGSQNSWPSGWLACDGSAISRTGAYAPLFNIVGTIYGSGDGSTTFNLPDYRGTFLRAVDEGANVDPDSGTRTAQFNASTSTNPIANSGSATGDTVGSRQADEFAAHSHTFQQSVYVNSDGNWSGGDWNNAQENTGMTGGSETRPKNVYVWYLIRAQ